MSAPYQPPVSHLLELGDALEGEYGYKEEFGISMAALPELERLLFDETFYYLGEDDKRTWGYIHAAYAIGELQTLEALQVLIKASIALWEHDFFWDVIPSVMSQIGPIGIPYLAEAFRKHRHHFEIGVLFIVAIREIGQQNDTARAQAVEALTSLLAEHAKNSETLNGSLIADLMDLKAVESLPVIQRAFEADHVATDIAGDWEDVQIDFGLKPPREDREELLRRFLNPPLDTSPLPWFPDAFEETEPHKDRTRARAPKQDADKARKKKQKAEKQAKKKNRKKK